MLFNAEVKVGRRKKRIDTADEIWLNPGESAVQACLRRKRLASTFFVDLATLIALCRVAR